MNRLYGLDTLRGLTLVSMIAYHACWDLVWMFGMDWDWYRGQGAFFWQQSICWTFILLSGYCWSLGRRHLRRGLTVFAAGALVSAVTLIAMPENAVRFGVLTLLGSASLLLIPLERILRRVPARLGLVGSFFLFGLLRNVSDGFVGLGGTVWFHLPESWYCNTFSAYLGFPPPGFFSTDYFPLLPWLLLFLTGYFLWRLRPEDAAPGPRVPVLTAMGRHSLLIYLLHQPILYACLSLWFFQS